MGILYDSVTQLSNESICGSCGAYIPAQGSQLCPECAGKAVIEGFTRGLTSENPTIKEKARVMMLNALKNNKSIGE